MGETIVMIHGMWNREWSWDHYKTFFENEGYRCVTPTLRYHDVEPYGKPDPRLGTTSLIEYAADLENLISKFDSPIILMGHSMGGLLAQILASRQIADAAVLLAPASPYGILALTPSVVRSFWSMLTTWKFWKKPGRQTFQEASYSTLGVLPNDVKKKAFERFVYESGRAAFEIGFWYLDSKKASKVDEKNISCPILIIVGTEDKITPASVVRKIADKYREIAVYKEFENHGHWIIGEPGWEKIAGYTSGWLNKVLRVKRFEEGVHIDQRKYKRTSQKAYITFSRSDFDFFDYGEMTNYSKGGLRFTTNIKINPGSGIFIKWADSAPGIIDSQEREVYSAEVIWYKQRNEDFLYDVGVQFSELDSP